jgi:hypothetical protein
VLTPLLILIVTAAVQVALVAHARHVAYAAARQGLRAASAYNGSPEEGEARADRYARLLSKGTLRDPAVRATRTGETATVEVRGHALKLLPVLGDLTVAVVVERPVERFVAAP